MATQVRKLAAIVFTDIVGYTALMGSDEDKAFDLLRKNREIHTKFIKQFHGTLIKEMGDGMLISFDLASEAVRCAVEIQKAAKSHDIPLKIGIHEGEMVFEGNDVLGDGVNIASRIQDDSETGCILISGSVYRDIKNKADIHTEFVGEQQFKNVDEKIWIYRVNCGEEKPNNKKQSIDNLQKSKFKKRKVLFGAIGLFLIISLSVLVWKLYFNEDMVIVGKSLAVIPFWDDSPDPDNAFFCFGMEDDIRMQLWKISELRIEPRESVEKYRVNHDKDITRIGEELVVDYILSGSARKIDNDIRIIINLFDTKTGDRIWGDTYDEDYSANLLDFQANTAKEIAASLNTIIKPNEAKRIDRPQTNNIEAHEFLIRGKYEMQLYYKAFDEEHRQKAIKHYDKALEIDPNYADVYASKASTFVSSENLDSMLYYADRALIIDPDHPFANSRKARYYQNSNDTDLAIEYYLKSLQYNPNDINTNIFLSQVYCLQKRDIQKGYPYLIRAMKLIGNGTDKLSNMATTLRSLGEYEKAEIYLNRHLKMGSRRCSAFDEYTRLLLTQGQYERALNFTDSICPLPDCDDWCSSLYMHLYVYRKEFSTAEQYIRELDEKFGTQLYNEKGYVYHNLGKIVEAEEVLNECLKGITEYLASTERPPHPIYYYWHAQVLAIQNRKNEALQSIKMIDERGLNYNLFDRMTHDPMFENLWDDPEFKAILKKVQDEKASIRAQIREMEEQAKLDK